MKKTSNKIFNNALWLMIYQITKIVFPFITLPYLTRVLTTETYGVITYVKTIMTYMQIFLDFGFVLSATKNIVNNYTNKNKLNFIIGDTLLARLILGICGFIIVLILSFSLPLLKDNIVYTLLSYIVVFESIFLMDFLFRGLEKMHIVAIRFVLMKVISTILTFILIKNDGNLLLIPLLDILSSFIAIVLVFVEIKKLNLKPKISKIKNALISIKESFVYFLSTIASTSINALSTIIIGIYLNSTEVAYWGICMQVIGTIQACYNPISDSIYPEMIRNKNINLLKKIIKIFCPIIVLGCIITYYLTPIGLNILGGKEYLKAVPIFRILIPTLFISFLAIIFGWPTLGAIGKQREVTLSTVISLTCNIVLMIILIIINKFTLVNVAIIRVLTECVLFLTRFVFYLKNKNEMQKVEV